MKKSFAKFGKQSITVFLFALLISLWAGGFFESYVFNFAFVQNFSVAEAQRLNGKTVRKTYYERQTKKEQLGKIIGYTRDSYALVRVQIAWDDDATSLYTAYPKSCFSKYIEVAE